MGITVSGFNADAGANQPDTGAEPRLALTPGRDGDTYVPTVVTLNGSGTTEDGRPQMFRWTQLPGSPAVRWLDPIGTPAQGQGPQPRWEAPAIDIETTFRFQLSVTAGSGTTARTETDTVDVTLAPAPNRAPIISSLTASNPTLPFSATTTYSLTRNATDPDGDPLTTTWRLVNPTLTAVQQAAAFPANGTSATFRWPVGVAVPSQPLVEVTVADNGTPQMRATRTLLLGAAPDPLSVALAADRATQDAGGKIRFTAQATTGATPAVGAVYSWRVAAGPAVTLPAASTAPSPVITLPAAARGSLTIEVTATQAGRSATATKTVAIAAPTPLNVSIPDPGLVAFNARVTITPVVTGVAPFTFERWSQTGGPSVALTPDPRTGAVAFTTPAAGARTSESISLSVIVTDASGASATAAVIVRVGAPSPPPSIDPGTVCATGLLGQVITNGLRTIAFPPLVTVNLGNVTLPPSCTVATTVSFSGASISVANGTLSGSGLGGFIDATRVCLTAGRIQSQAALKLPEADITATAPLCIAAGALSQTPSAVANATPGTSACLLSGRLTYNDRFPFLDVPGAFTPGPASLTFACGTVSVAGGGTLLGANANLSVTVQGNGDFSGTVGLTNLALLGGTANLSGAVSRVGTSTTFNVAGDLANPQLGVPGLAVPSAAITWTNQGIAVNAVASMTPAGGAPLDLRLAGVWRSNEEWSLTASAATTGPWTVAPGMDLAKATVVGSASRANGATTFDIALDATGEWVVIGPDTLKLRTVKGRISNQIAPTTCPALSPNETWLSLSGDATLKPPAPAGATPFDLSVGGCIGFTSGSFRLNLLAKLNEWRPIANVDVALRSLQFNVTRSGETFNLEGLGAMAAQGVELQARVLFRQPGNILVIDGRGDLGRLNIPLVSSGHVIYATAPVLAYQTVRIEPDGAVVNDLAPFDLPAGLTMATSFEIDTATRDLLEKQFGIAAPVGGIVAIASLGTGGITLKVMLSLGPEVFLFKTCPASEMPACADPRSRTSLRLKSGFLSFSSSGTFGIGGEAELHLPSSGEGRAPSDLQLTVQLSVSLAGPSVTLALYTTGNWNDALGLKGLVLGQLAIQGGIVFNPPPAPPTPTIAFLVEVIRLPDASDKAAGGIDLATPLGIVNNNEPMLFAAQISQSAPIFELTLGVDSPDGTPPFLRPLALVDGINGPVGRTMDVDFATMVIAPLGGTIGPRTYDPGLTLAFGATIMQTPVDMRMHIGLLPPVVEANASVGEFTVAGLTMQGAVLDLKATALPPTFSLSVSGSVDLGDPTMSASATVNLDPLGQNMTFAFDGRVANWEIAPGTRLDQFRMSGRAGFTSFSAPPALQLQADANGTVLGRRMAFGGELEMDGTTLRRLDLRAAPGSISMAAVTLRGKNGTSGNCSTLPGAPTNSPCVRLAFGAEQPLVFTVDAGIVSGPAHIDFTGGIDELGLGVSGTMAIDGVTNPATPVTVVGKLYTANAPSTTPVISWPRVPAQNAEGDWTFTRTLPVSGDWFVEAIAKNIDIAGFSPNLDFRAGKVGATSYVAANGSLNFGDSTAPNGTGGSVTLAGIVTKVGENVSFDLAGDASLVVNGYPVAEARGRLTNTSIELAGKVEIPSNDVAKPTLRIDLAGAACLGPCVSIIPESARSLSNQLNVSIAGDAELNVSGFEVGGSASLASVPNLQQFRFTGDINTTHLDAHVEGDMQYASGAFSLCVSGNGSLHRSGPDPTGTASFCTSPFQAKVDMTLPYNDGFNSGTFTFKGALTSNSMNLVSRLNGEILVANWHQPCHPGWTECRDRVTYVIEARMKIVSGGTPTLSLNGSAGAHWFVDRRRSSPAPTQSTVDGPISDVSITLSPFKVCLPGGCAPL